MSEFMIDDATLDALADVLAARVVAKVTAATETAKPKARKAPKAAPKARKATPKARKATTRKTTPQAVPSMTRVLHRGVGGAVRDAFVAENPRFAGMGTKTIQAYLAEHKDEIPAGWTLPTGYVRAQVAKS